MKVWLLVLMFVVGWTSRGLLRPPLPESTPEASRKYIEQHVKNCKSDEIRAMYPAVRLKREDGVLVDVPCAEFLAANDKP